MGRNRDRPVEAATGSGGRIRVLALALIRRDGSLLVSEGHDSVKDETFYRLLGGELEFGETGAEAVAREVREELGAEVEPPVYPAMLENVYTYEGARGHEIALVYDVTLRRPLFDDRLAWDAPVGGGIVLHVLWKPLADFSAGALLYPDGALALVGD